MKKCSSEDEGSLKSRTWARRTQERKKRMGDAFKNQGAGREVCRCQASSSSADGQRGHSLVSRGGSFYAFDKENTEIRAGALSQLGRLSHIGRAEGEACPRILFTVSLATLGLGSVSSDFETDLTYNCHGRA